MDISKLNSKMLNHRRGFRSIKSEAMTGAERLRKHRAKIGGRSLSFYLEADAAVAMLYIRRQWGMRTYKEAVRAALLHLAKDTRSGLQKLELGINVDEEDTQW